MTSLAQRLIDQGNSSQKGGAQAKKDFKELTDLLKSTPEEDIYRGKQSFEILDGIALSKEYKNSRQGALCQGIKQFDSPINTPAKVRQAFWNVVATELKALDAHHAERVLRFLDAHMIVFSGSKIEHCKSDAHKLWMAIAMGRNGTPKDTEIVDECSRLLSYLLNDRQDTVSYELYHAKFEWTGAHQRSPLPQLTLEQHYETLEHTPSYGLQIVCRCQWLLRNVLDALPTRRVSIFGRAPASATPEQVQSWWTELCNITVLLEGMASRHRGLHAKLAVLQAEMLRAAIEDRFRPFKLFLPKK